MKRVTASRVVVLLLLALTGGSLPAAQTPGERPQAIFQRAVADFQSGRIAESVAGFDALARLIPDDAPQLWQRGIALYYAGRYRDCRAQFESHRTVNPNDVENAAWHFACVARAETPARAKAALLPVGPDARRPMGEIYRMFSGKERKRILDNALFADDTLVVMKVGKTKNAWWNKSQIARKFRIRNQN